MNKFHDKPNGLSHKILSMFDSRNIMIVLAGACLAMLATLLLEKVSDIPERYAENGVFICFTILFSIILFLVFKKNDDDEPLV